MKHRVKLFAVLAMLNCMPLVAEDFNIDTFMLGKIHYGMSVAGATGLPGCVFTKGKLIASEADGAWHQGWKGRSCGVNLGFSAADKKSALKLTDIEILAPSQIKTTRGIGIGSTEAQVRTQYSHEINAGESIPQQTVVLGSVYGGVVFGLEGGKVQRILVGAAAE
jgi:hypothetical protein